MSGLHFSCRIRRTPYTSLAEQAGVTGFSVVNHMLLPKSFTESVEEDYWHLREFVQLWDVSCQRQIEVFGKDAAELVQLMTPRSLRRSAPGRCLYLPLIDRDAGIVNDPVLFRMADDRFRLSIADSDVELFARGIAAGRGLSVRIRELAIWPLAVQGPLAAQLIERVHGPCGQLRHFDWDWFEFEGSKLVVSRTGYSSQDGYEIYLEDQQLAEPLWTALMRQGKAFNIRPGCPNLIDRIEAGLRSYGNEMTIDSNPIEMRMERFCCLDGSVDYLGRRALETIWKEGTRQVFSGFSFGGGPCGACSAPWPILLDGEPIGRITSAAWSPRRKRNVALGIVSRRQSAFGNRATVRDQSGTCRSLTVESTPIP